MRTRIHTIDDMMTWYERQCADATRRFITDTISAGVPDDQIEAMLEIGRDWQAEERETFRQKAREFLLEAKREFQQEPPTVAHCEPSPLRRGRGGAGRWGVWSSRPAFIPPPTITH